MHTVLDLLASIETLSDDKIGSAASSLADHYRASGNVDELRVLLEHSDPRLVSLGAWILSECANPNKDYEFKTLLIRLLAHSDAAVRLEAVRALSLFASVDDKLVKHVMRMLGDDNSAVRHIAMLNLCLFPDESFRSTSGGTGGDIVRDCVTKDQIVCMASSHDTYEQNVALIGTLRNFGDDQEFVRTVVDMLPRVITKHMSVLPRNKRFT